jgi:hypothetical protein
MLYKNDISDYVPNRVAELGRIGIYIDSPASRAALFENRVVFARISTAANPEYLARIFSNSGQN